MMILALLELLRYGSRALDINYVIAELPSAKYLCIG